MVSYNSTCDQGHVLWEQTSLYHTGVWGDEMTVGKQRTCLVTMGRQDIITWKVIVFICLEKISLPWQQSCDFIFIFIIF